MIRKIIKFLSLFRKTYLTDFIKVHYSQFGEDIILKELITKDVTDGFYIDVGCYHPKKYSNTYMLYKRGWRGINIDLEEDKIKCFKLARPKDLNILAAVSDKVEKVTVIRFSKYGVGTRITPEGGEFSNQEIYDAYELETRTLNEIIKNSPFNRRRVDLLCIDAEGHDLQVLKSIDLDFYRPKVIIIEGHFSDINSLTESEIYCRLDLKGYKLVSWVFMTLIFILPGSDILNTR